MAKKPKLLFDECIGRPIVERIAGLIAFDRSEVEVAHCLDLKFGGLPDVEWIPLVARDG